MSRSSSQSVVIVVVVIVIVNIVVIVPHSYLPGLALCDFFLFPRMKLHLQGTRSHDVPEIQ
jgi:hypothetical protein